MGTLLGGRVHYRQLNRGYRTGIEPVLLAAAVPARPGERVVEGGTGAGAGLLCLAARVPELLGIGVEIDPTLVQVARGNLEANGLTGRLFVQEGDVAQWRPDGMIDHAFVNPPWHDPAGTASPVAGRRKAKQSSQGLLQRWAVSLGAGLRQGGTLTMILPASLLATGCAALVSAGCPQITLFPLWPRAAHAAKMVVLSGVRLRRGPNVVLPGLVLHEADGRYTEMADNVLRGGAALVPSWSGSRCGTRSD